MASRVKGKGLKEKINTIIHILYRISQALDVPLADLCRLETKQD
jgi:hypothetical protein